MNVVVTGASGFIGTHLVARLVAGGARVRALVRRQMPWDPGPLVEIVQGDVRDPAAVARAVAGQEVVYHLAKAPSDASLATMRSVNVDGTALVARAAARAGVRRLVHCSTAAVYGRICRGAAVSEQAPMAPDSAYARSKAKAELLLRSNPIRASLPVVVARITHVMGPGARNSRRLFRAIEERRSRLIGGGNNSHHPADVSDVVDGLLRCGTAAAAEGRTYNLASAEPITLREFLARIAEELGVKGGPTVRLPAAPFHLYRRLHDLAGRAVGLGLPRGDGIAFLLGDRALDISRAREELSYAPAIDPAKMVHRTAVWYRTTSGGTGTGPE